MMFHVIYTPAIEEDKIIGRPQSALIFVVKYL